MKNLNLIEVKYLGPTNNKGSRVKLTSHRLKETVTIPYDYNLNHPLEMAEAYLKEKGLPVVGCAEGKKTDYVLLDSTNNRFDSIK